MARKKMFSDKDKQDMVQHYKEGNSLSDTGTKFGVSLGTVLYHLKKQAVKRRTVAEGNSLKWQNKDFRDNQVSKRTGKPSGALGKRWTVPYKVDRNNRGERNPNWKGGKTKLSQLIRSSVEYKIWRMAIFKRDWFTCQICGAMNKKGEKYIFDADHIYPFHKILDDNNITSVEEAISCKDLWDINNGRCLCRECHKKTDTWGVNRLLIT